MYSPYSEVRLGTQNWIKLSGWRLSTIYLNW